ncbi:MAG: hypothetical protein LJF30_21445, partial [Acidobacteria bacterium]|nr:hypothetical protein [Acidobacteriota bacterium]
VSAGRIYLAHRDGSESRPLLEVGDGSMDLRWAPDGRRLRYSSWGPEGREHERWIWETSTAGEPPRAICAGSGGVWVGDSHYVFSRGPALKLGNLLTDRFVSDLYAIRDDEGTAWLRGEPVRLTFGPLRYTQPGTPPDRKRLFAWGESFRGELLRYDLEERDFRPYLSGLSASEVDVSPDGAWLAWVSYPEQALWRGRPDGSERLQLTTPPLLAFWPQWSPDGREIAFIGARPGEFGLTLQVISPDVGGMRTMPSDSAEHALPWNPCWVEGGRAVAFSPMVVRKPLPDWLFLWEPQANEVRAWSGTEWMLWPVCSLQGQVLTQRFRPDYSSPRSSVYSPETKSWTHDAPSGGAYPTWTSDGRSIVFLDLVSMQIRRLWPQTGRVETIADVGDMQLGGPTIAPWLGLAPDDSPLVMRSHDTREIYELEFEAP